MGIIEPQAYGAIASSEGRENGDFKVTFTAMNDLFIPKMKILHDRPRLVGDINGHQCYVYRAHVKADYSLFRGVTVHWINIHGIDVKTLEEVVQTIRPKKK